MLAEWTESEGLNVLFDALFASAAEGLTLTGRIMDEIAAGAADDDLSLNFSFVALLSGFPSLQSLLDVTFEMAPYLMDEYGRLIYDGEILGIVDGWLNLTFEGTDWPSTSDDGTGISVMDLWNLDPAAEVYVREFEKQLAENFTAIQEEFNDLEFVIKMNDIVSTRLTPLNMAALGQVIM